MTLLEIKSFICNKFGKTDSSSLARVEDSVKNRYKYIWEIFTWNETKRLVTQTYSANGTALLVDSSVELIISVASDGAFIPNIQFEELMRLNIDALTESNSPLRYVDYPKSGANCVIRLVPMPAQDVTLNILGKGVFTQLTGDSDTPKLRGIDNALLAFCEGDFLQRERQYGKAQAKFSEADQMLVKMAQIEQQQQQKQVQIIPFATDWNYSEFPYDIPTKENIY